MPRWSPTTCPAVSGSPAAGGRGLELLGLHGHVGGVRRHRHLRAPARSERSRITAMVEDLPDGFPGNLRYVNTATVSWDASTATSGTSTVRIRNADLWVTKNGPDEVRAGDVIAWRVRVGNDGPNAATGVVVVDHLPPGTTFLSADGPGWSCEAAGRTVTCRHAGPRDLAGGRGADHHPRPGRRGCRPRPPGQPGARPKLHRRPRGRQRDGHAHHDGARRGPDLEPSDHTGRRDRRDRGRPARSRCGRSPRSCCWRESRARSRRALAAPTPTGRRPTRPG